MSQTRLQRLPGRCWLHAALVALLLFVQHGALNHALLHVAGHGETAAQIHAGHDHAHDEERPSGELSANCGFDLLYSEVLGGVHGSCQGVVTGAIRAVLIAPGSFTTAGISAVPYDSRAPPALS